MLRCSQIVGRDGAASQQEHQHPGGTRDVPIAGFPATYRTAIRNLEQARQGLGAEAQTVADRAEFGGGHVRLYSMQWSSVSQISQSVNRSKATQPRAASSVSKRPWLSPVSQLTTLYDHSLVVIVSSPISGGHHCPVDDIYIGPSVLRVKVDG